MEPNYVISLEIGSSAVSVSAATFAMQSGAVRGPMTIFAVCREPLYHSVRYGRILNVEEVARSVENAVGRLAGAPELAGKKIMGVYAGVGGRSLMSKLIKVELPLPNEQEITDDIIERLQQDAMASVDNRLEVLDIIPQSYTVDGVFARQPVGTYGRRIAAEFNMIVCNPLNTLNLERVVCDRCHLDLCGMVVRPQALGDLVLGPDDTKPGCMLVDLGAETTTISIYKEGRLRYLSTVPLGSHHITADLASGLGVVEAQAEQIKITQGNALEDSTMRTPEQRQVDEFVQSRVIEIIANIVAHIGFAKFTIDELRAGIIVTGQGVKLKNFCKLLEVQSHLPVRVAQVPNIIRVSAQYQGDRSDLLPLMAISAEGAVRSNEPDALPCVVVPAPKVVKTAAPAKPKESDSAPAWRIDGDEDDRQGADYNYAGNGGLGGGYGSDAGYDGAPGRYDGDDVLLDDDEAERRRRDEAERAEQQRRKEAERRRREEEKRAAEAARRNTPSLWDRILTRVGNLIDKTDNGYDND